MTFSTKPLCGLFQTPMIFNNTSRAVLCDCELLNVTLELKSSPRLIYGMANIFEAVFTRKQTNEL